MRGFARQLPCWVMVVLSLISPPPLVAQPDTLPRPSHRAQPRSAPVHIDGRLTEGDWDRAAVARDFTQRRPDPNARESQLTEVRVLVDDAALYVGARLHDRNPSLIAAQLARRDADDLYSDVFSVLIDSYFDRRTAYRFSVTPAGVQGDAFHFNDSDDDENWDAVWESAVAIDSAGWSAELRIPFSQLRFGGVEESAARRWGIQFSREVARLGEVSYWSPSPPTLPGFVSRFGTLDGLERVRPPARIELVPYLSAQVTTLANELRNPLVPATDATGRVGADVRYGMPRGLTLTATLNPDFGQVEVDPAVVNLTAFETFFPERRPFFLEGMDIFRFGSTVTINDNDPPQPFYSRRIGRAPRGAGTIPGAQYVSAPAQTDILGAVKVSGKTPSGWSLGVLGAQTAVEHARVLGTSGAEREALVEPRGNFFVGRVSRDFRDGSTIVGIGSTAVARQPDAALAPVLPRSAALGGITAEHAWDERTWIASGYGSWSRVQGDRRYVAALQRSNTHAFQRPDRTDRQLDPDRDALTGHFFALSLAKMGGRHWLGSATYEETGPGYDVNELGFQRRSDIRSFGTALRYQERTPVGIVNSWTATGYNTRSTNFSGDVIEQRFSLLAESRLRNLWELQLLGNIQPSTLDDRLTRGGPLARRPTSGFVQLEVSTDSRRPVSADVEVSHRFSRAGNRGNAAAVALNLRPSSAVRLSVEPQVTRQVSVDQFVTAVPDPGAAATFGRRYVFGELRQQELEIETRAEWTFSPRLSLQVFAQPFVSSGRFERFKEFRAPRSFAFDVYGRDRGTIERDRDAERVIVDPDGAGPAESFEFDEQDFTVRALRGNAVLRWEFRPGSALFLVWQQVREDETVGSDLGATWRPAESLRAPAENVLLAKVTYWFGR